MNAYLHSADRVISVSQKVADDITQEVGIAQEKIRVVHNAPSEDFKPITDQGLLNQIREKICFTRAIVSFRGGNLSPKEFSGPDSGLSKARQRYSISLGHRRESGWKARYELDFVGRLRIEDKVQMIGWIDHQDLPAIYQLASCFILPSFHELCSVALLEALASGCPVIASSSGGNPEVVGDAAQLINWYDLHEVKDAMLRMTRDAELRQELSRKGF